MRLSGCVLGEWRWLEVVAMLFYVLFVGMCLGAVSAYGGVVWACVFGMGFWWECVV